jgi:DNA-binding beta-propeller fold protein YncE
MLSRLARTALATALVLAVASPAARAATPSAYVYATSWDQVVRQYEADDAGLLQDLSPPDAPAGNTSTSAAVSPDDRSLYVVNQISATVSQYDIAADGTLTPKTPSFVATGRSPWGMTIAPDGRHAYVVNQGDRTVGVYAVNSAGALTLASTAATGAGAVQIALTPDGSHAYVTNFSIHSVSQFDVNADGSLTPMVPATVEAGPSPRGIAVSPDGASIYVANQAAIGTVAQFSVGPGGKLTAKSTPFVAAGANSRNVLATPAGVYVTNITSGTISQYDADPATGALAPKPAGAVASPRGPDGLAVSPDGRSMYVAASSSDGAFVAQYDVDAIDGSLSPKSPASQPASFHPVAIAVARPLDRLAPTIDLRTPADGARYALGASVVADYSCADEGGSGLEACAGDVADGAAIDTSTVGPHELTVVARDGAGHETSVTHTYVVVEQLGFDGFRGWIRDGSVVRAGHAIPIAFSLGGDRGLDVLQDGSPASAQVDCADPGEPTGGEAADSWRDRGLTYDSSTERYLFVWRTRAAWAGTCRSFVLTLADGSVHRLVVRFRHSWSWRW